MSDWTAAHSSEKMDWGTPQALFDALDEEFSFNLDAAANDHNAKCGMYLTQEDDALAQPSWPVPRGSSVWLNPPYGREYLI